MMNVLFGLHGGMGLYWRRGRAHSTHSEVIGAALCAGLYIGASERRPDLKP